MRLSEAIRLGATLGPQAFGKLRDRETEATCALGAAAEALRVKGLWGVDLKESYPWSVEDSPEYCPACARKGQSPAAVIVHLNDHHRWSREAIADWVELLENRLPRLEALRPSKPTLKLA